MINFVQINGKNLVFSFLNQLTILLKLLSSQSILFQCIAIYSFDSQKITQKGQSSLIFLFQNDHNYNNQQLKIRLLNFLSFLAQCMLEYEVAYRFYIIIVQMNPQNIARSNQIFEKANATHNFRFQLHSQPIQPFFVLELTSSITKCQYELYMENYDISRSKQLSNIFHNIEQLYLKLIETFDSFSIREQENDAILKCDVDVGKPKKEEVILVLQIKKQDHLKRFKKWKFDGFLNSSIPAVTSSSSKVEIDRCYAQDLKYFKSELKNSIDVIVNSRSVEECRIPDRQCKVQLKNMFIAFSNAIMRVCRQKSVIINDETRKRKNVITKPPNRMLVQKNKFFETVLEGGLERVQKLQAQQMNLNLNPDIPSDLIVVKQNGEEVNLDSYLSSFSCDQIQKKIKFDDERLEQFATAGEYLKAEEEQLIQQTKIQLKQINRRKQLIENYKKKKNQSRSQSSQL